MEVTVRWLVIVLFLLSAVLLLYAYRKRPFTYHLLGIVFWCVHVIIFTSVAALRGYGIIDVGIPLLNVWSNIVRLHGGIVMFTTGLYYVNREEF